MLNVAELTDKTDQLTDHAQALIDMAKTFVTKPVGRKQPKKQPAAKPVKSGKDPTALDVLHRMTMNKLTTHITCGSGWFKPSK